MGGGCCKNRPHLHLFGREDLPSTLLLKKTREVFLCMRGSVKLEMRLSPCVTASAVMTHYVCV